MAQMDGASAGSRLLQASKAKLLQGTHNMDPYDALSPRQRELVGANGSRMSEQRSRKQNRGSSGASPGGGGGCGARAAVKQKPNYVQLAISTNGVIETTDTLPTLQEMKYPLVPLSSDNEAGRCAATATHLSSQSFPGPRKRPVKPQASKPLGRSVSLDAKLQRCKFLPRLVWPLPLVEAGFSLWDGRGSVVDQMNRHVPS